MGAKRVQGRVEALYEPRSSRGLPSRSSAKAGNEALTLKSFAAEPLGESDPKTSASI